jgi:uncharacterized OsmC-like protein
MPDRVGTVTIGPMPTSTSRDADLRVAKALARLEAALEQRRDFGRVTSRSTTTLVQGLRCSTAEGVHVMSTDLPAALGGEGTAPSPSCLIRAALGSCLAMGYRLRAARRGIQLGAIRVVVESDSEISGLVLGESPPGFSELRVHVEIETDELPEVVRQLIDEADRRSPMLDVVQQSNHVRRSLAVEARSV